MHAIQLTYFQSAETNSNKKYIISPECLNEIIARRFSKTIYQPIQVNDRQKNFFIKVFQSSSHCQNEFEAHQTIHKRIEERKEHLLRLGITPGTGIEKRPPCASFHPDFPFMIKKPYRENLHDAIRRGLYSGNWKLLLEGAKQLTEGLITLIEIGALYTDIKTKNILCGRKGKIELAHTDFEGITFLSPDNQDETLKKMEFRTAEFMVPYDEFMKLAFERHFKEISPDEFSSRLHKLYSINLGGIFLEMATKLNLMQFLFLKDFSHILSLKGASKECIDQFWSAGCGLEYNKYSLISIDPQYNEMFQFFCMGAPKGPSLYSLSEDDAEKLIIEAIEQTGAKKEFAELVASMVRMDPSKRISIKDVLPRLAKITP